MQPHCQPECVCVLYYRGLDASDMPPSCPNRNDWFCGNAVCGGSRISRLVPPPPAMVPAPIPSLRGVGAAAALLLRDKNPAPLPPCPPCPPWLAPLPLPLPLPFPLPLMPFVKRSSTMAPLCVGCSPPFDDGPIPAEPSPSPTPPPLPLPLPLPMFDNGVAGTNAYVAGEYGLGVAFDGVPIVEEDADALCACDNPDED